jgi:hypothetical protein
MNYIGPAAAGISARERRVDGVKMSLSRFAGIAMVALVACAPAGLSAEESSDSLPDTRAFLEEVQKNLKSDGLLLDQYTFTETFREARLDAKGSVKKSKTEIYEVYPSVDFGKTYRRLVARDGTPISPAQLADQDRKQEAKADAKERRLAAEDEAARDRRRARQEERKRKERAVIEEVFRMDDIAVVGRESIDGRPTVVVQFAPRPGFRPATQGGKVIQKLAGKAWIDEEDRQLVRLEAKLLDSLGVGPGGFARLQKGATAYFHRRKVNGEIWLPTEARFTGAAKALILFGARLDIHSTYGDYKKFSVGTQEEITSPE